MILTKEFLNALDTKEGDNLAIYDVVGRKVYFIFHGANNTFRLKMIRGKRKLPVKVRRSDKTYRVNPDGTILRGNIPEFIYE